MTEVTMEQVTAQLRHLPPGLLAEAYEYISRLSSAESSKSEANKSESVSTMLASENLLRRDWDLPEEDAAWAHL